MTRMPHCRQWVALTGAHSAHNGQTFMADLLREEECRSVAVSAAGNPDERQREGTAADGQPSRHNYWLVFLAGTLWKIPAFLSRSNRKEFALPAISSLLSGF